MKKLAATLAAAAAMTAGVLTMTATDANAGYPGAVKVDTTVNAPKHIEPGQKAVVHLTVTAPGAKVGVGKVRFVVKNKKGKVVATRVRAFNKKHLTFHTPKLGKGKYTLVAVYVGKRGGVFKGSRSVSKLSVN